MKENNRNRIEIFGSLYYDIEQVVCSKAKKGITAKDVRTMQELSNTQYFCAQKDQEQGVKEVIATVYRALTEKGYNPVNQIVGYVMSGDPTYITSHLGARSLIMKVERDEIIEELLKDYIQYHFM